MSNDKDLDTNVDVEETTEINDEDFTFDEDETSLLEEETQKKIQTLAAQRKVWKEKAVDPESGKTYRELFEEGKAAQETAPEQSEKPSDFDSLADNLAVLRDLNTEEVNKLRGEAKDLGTDPIKYIQSNGGQARLAQIRAEQKSEDATPDPTSTGFNVKGKTWAQMDNTERKANFNAKMQSMSGKGRKGFN